MINIDKLLAEGRELARREKIIRDFANSGNSSIKGPIRTALVKIAPVSEALEKITGKASQITVDPQAPFPVFIETGLVVNQPDCTYTDRYLKSPRLRAWTSDICKSFSSLVTVKGRGHKLILQAGNKAVNVGILGSDYVVRPRILARGAKDIIRYIARFEHL